MTTVESTVTRPPCPKTTVLLKRLMVVERAQETSENELHGTFCVVILNDPPLQSLANIY